MPRTPKVKSPIRDLRAIIGKTQREFAFSIGISPIALTRIENGTLALSRRVARRIVCETAIDPRCLNGKLRTLRNRRGDVYTKEFYKAFKDTYSWQDEAAVKVAIERLSLPMETLLRASAVGSKKRLWSVFDEIADALDRCRIDFNLQRPIAEILAKQRHPKWEYLIIPSSQWEGLTAPRKRRSSSRRLKKA